ncbi:MAG: 2-amino-4-hydroxy-6-hydroxymethyldihydropteridine diphosphokinase [Caldimicrobium sp.]
MKRGDKEACYPEKLNRVYLSLGTNLGDRLENLKRAIQLLKRLPLFIEATSKIYETAPLYFETSNRFFNMVIQIKTSLSPYALFLELKKIEFLMGRIKEERLTDRPIDLDIIFYEDLTLEGKILQIPHPRAYERAFVMIPLCELAPNFSEPLSGKKIYELCKERERLFESQEILPLLGEKVI